MGTISQKDIGEIDEHMKTLEAANVDPAFKRKALVLFAETKAIAIEMLPLFLRGDEIENKITELVNIYPQYKKYI